MSEFTPRRSKAARLAQAGQLPSERHAQSRPPPPEWLPPGTSCAICFSIDDVHPARGSDPFEAGGDLENGALGHLLWLTERHPQLRASLCVTADWRAKGGIPTKRLLGAIPWISNRSFLAERWPEGTMRLDRHPDFVAFLKTMPGIEIVPHGLHHICRGPLVTTEFANATYEECARALRRIDEIIRSVGLTAAPGHSPPGWSAPPPLRRAMKDAGLLFLASARDIRTRIRPDALTAMSGMIGQPLIFPSLTEEGLVHIAANFQATNDADRAMAILECGGLLSIKAHIVKSAGRYTALDGLDRLYVNYLDSLFSQVKSRFGDRIWWASMTEIAERFLAARRLPATAAAA